jgi:hypothetical protein
MRNGIEEVCGRKRVSRSGTDKFMRPNKWRKESVSGKKRVSGRRSLGREMEVSRRR